MKIDIALSCDYELSLGSARGYARNLFVPTARLLEAAAALAVSITLFEIGGLEGPPCVAIVDVLREKNVG